MNIEVGSIIELDNGVELFITEELKGLYVAMNFSGAFDEEDYILQPVMDEKGDTYVRVRGKVNEKIPLEEQIEQIANDPNGPTIEISSPSSSESDVEEVKKMIDDFLKDVEISTFEESVKMRTKVEEDKSDKENCMDASKDMESMEKIENYARTDFDLMPGRGVPGIMVKENRGNIFETPTPKELEGLIREYSCTYNGFNKEDKTIFLQADDDIIKVKPIEETVYSSSIVKSEGICRIKKGDDLYVIALGNDDSPYFVAVTIIRLEEKIAFEQIRSLYGRANAIRRFYRLFGEEQGKIDYVVGQTGGVRYNRYESSEDHVFDSKIEQELKYAMTKETFPIETQRAFEAMFRDPLSMKHKTDQKLRYLSRICPHYTDRKSIDAMELKELLDKKFYKMDRVKNQIIDVLVSNEHAGIRGFNMLLVGGPGVGKTSIMETIAKAYNIPSEMIPLNGMCCPQELEGLDSGYDSSDAGRLVRAFAGHGTSEMVIGFDEIDKVIRTSHEGDPLNVLYRMFTGIHEDKFLACPISTENTIFIATANNTENIPEPIMNRFNSVIYIDDYSADDKLQIAKYYVIPKLMKKYSLDNNIIEFDDRGLRLVISDYCEDGGARDLEHNLDMIIRRVLSSEKYPEGILIEEGYARNVLEETVPETMGIFFNKHRDEYSAEVAAEIKRAIIETKVSISTSYDRFGVEKNRQKLKYLLACRNEKKTFADGFDPVRFSDVLHENLLGMDKVIKELTVFYHTLASQGTLGIANLAVCGGYGIGKTQIAQNVAAALGYHFVKISLNGIADMKELRGFSSTYSGSEPGRIIRSVKEAGSFNAVFQLDEIDKLSPEMAIVLLDLLDRTFTDNFLGFPVEFRNSIFIATANEWGKVPPVVRDRFIVVEANGYTREEKSRILSDYVIPKLEKSYAAAPVSVSIDPDAKQYLLETYCPSFGVRDVEKAMQQIVGGKLVEQFGQKDANLVKIDRNDISRFMGEEPIPGGNFPENGDQPGITKALAVTGGNQGSVFAIETVLLEGDESLEITGLPKEITIDSVKVAVTCIRSMDPQLLSGKKIHVHFGEGAVPKDGPSAGIALFMSIYSAATGIVVKYKKPYDIAFTGEISLTGGVFAVGGVLEKIQAASDSGCGKVYIPEQNYIRLDPDKLKSFGCRVVPVQHINQVIEDLARKEV